MLMNTACTFLFSVLTCYTFYRYTVHPNELLKQLSFIHSVWLLLFFTSTIAVIYSSELMTSEASFTIRVNSIHSELNVNRNQFFFPFHNFQGKLTFKLLHDKMNRCNEADMSLSVWNSNFI